MAPIPRLVRGRRAFDVICAGEPLWRAARLAGGDLAAPTTSAGLLEIARMLSRRTLRVGLAIVLDDDRFGRSSVAEATSMGIDVGGVTLAPPAAGLVVVDASGGQLGVLSERGMAPAFEVPTAWSSRVLLLSGLSPVTSKAAALVRAARRARREGTTVVLDAVGSLRQWTGHDPRTVAMVLREADVVRCSHIDLAVLGTESASVRRAMRSDATLVVGDGAGTTATGAFGEVRVKGRARAGQDAGEECTAAICAELARPHRGGPSAETPDGRWHRVLSAHAARISGT
jgi:fructokinase/2-dehydro-3-deoxygluconokinase